MGDQPVINAIMPHPLVVESPASMRRRVLCGGLFGMYGTGKIGALNSAEADASDRSVGREAKQDFAS